MINPPIYRLTTAVSDIDQTNVNSDIRDGNWLSNLEIPLLDSSFKFFHLKKEEIVRPRARVVGQRQVVEEAVLEERGGDLLHSFLHILF